MQRSTSSKRPRKRGLARSALAFLLVLIMLAAQAVGYLPAPARAETGAQTFSLDESGLMIKLTSATGATSYCGEAPKMAPSGYTYSTWYYTGLAPDGTFTCDRHALAWLISQGYPFTTTPGGFTCDDPADVTQMAIWMLLGQIDERGWSADGEIKYDYTGNRNYITTADLQRAWQFSRTALEHAGEEGIWDTLSKWWVAPTGVIQSVVECQPVPKQGGIEIWKGSSNPGLTSGNRAYSLEGAVYGIDRDEACRDLVDKMTTDAEGHATYEPLDLGTYWLKELEPPKNHKRDETVHRVEVNGEGVNTRVDLTDEPLYAAAHFYVQKVDANGAAGLIFYIAVVATIVLFLTEQPLPGGIVMAVMFGVPLIVILFKEPITRAIQKRADKMEVGKGMFLVQGFFEMFETLLSYFSNTISFIRIGAFAVSHAAIMEVVLQLAGAESGNPNWIGVIFGNLFVCGFEGLIVGIQVLRLEYYEMFSRFYKGSGHAFDPYTKKKTNKK